MTFGVGCTAGWPSAALLILQSDTTPLPSGPLTIYEASWIYSLPTIGAVIGNFLYGWICSKYGRKIPLLSTSIPAAVRVLVR